MAIMTPQEQQVMQARLVVATKQVEERRRMAHRLPEKVWDLVDALRQVAAIREEADDFVRAERLYKEALGHAKIARKPRADVMFSLQSHLGYLYDRLNEPEKAIDAYQQALQASQGQTTADADAAGHAAHTSPGLSRQNHSDFPVADVYFDRSAVRQSPEPVPLRKEAAANGYGVLHYGRENPAKALDMHQRALSLRQASVASAPHVKQQDVRQSCMNLAFVFKTLGDETRASFYSQQAEVVGTEARAMPRFDRVTA
jgi:tetratricopeptide (TPR) repeat protein